MATDTDTHCMEIALRLASRGLGDVGANPAVGCVIVRDGVVVGRGWTGTGGRPHAETEALARAGEAARGGTAYVSLEPCAHHGATPPCADALIEAGVIRCFVALQDPDPRTAGRGIAKLRDAGIDVSVGACAAQARALNAGFLSRVIRRRPWVVLKLASTVDGAIATHDGESQWITGPIARQRAHLMRARTDAVMIGIGTAINDRPKLTCRLPGLEGRSPVRMVVDGRLQLPLTSQLVETARETETWVICLAGCDRARRDAFRSAGVDVITVEPAADGRPDMRRGLVAVAERGINCVMVEGGAKLSATLFRDGLIDELAWFRAGLVVGGDGIPGVGAMGLQALADAPRLERESIALIGEDVLETYTVATGGD